MRREWLPTARSVSRLASNRPDRRAGKSMQRYDPAMTDQDQDQARRELANMDMNRGRFGIEGSAEGDSWRVVDVSQLPPIPASDWMSQEDAIHQRDRLFRSDP